MQICGLQKTTLLDYPEKVAATVFTRGCNFRCPYCHNMNLVEPQEEPSVIPEDEIFDFLKKRQGILDGVCVTGGEPTIHPKLPDLIQKIKALGLLVKLDTNGTNPELLSFLINEDLIDYVAMDIKSSFNNYSQVAGIATKSASLIVSKLKQSIDILKNGSIPYEFRTTVIREYHNAQVFDEIGEMLAGCSQYYLQSFKDSEFVKAHELTAYTKEELLGFAKQLQKYHITAYVRGV